MTNRNDLSNQLNDISDSLDESTTVIENIVAEESCEIQNLISSESSDILNQIDSLSGFIQQESTSLQKQMDFIIRYIDVKFEMLTHLLKGSE